MDDSLEIHTEYVGYIFQKIKVFLRLAYVFHGII